MGSQWPREDPAGALSATRAPPVCRTSGAATEILSTARDAWQGPVLCLLWLQLYNEYIHTYIHTSTCAFFFFFHIF